MDDLVLAIEGSLASSSATIVTTDGDVCAIHSRPAHGLHYREMASWIFTTSLNELCWQVVSMTSERLGISFDAVVRRIRTVATSIAGLDQRFDPLLMIGYLQESIVFTGNYPRRKMGEDVDIIIRGIAEACHISAFFDGPGVLVRAGVGCSVFGRNKECQCHLANAWGFLPGDLGGAYHIGQQVLHRLTRSYDRRATADEQEFAEKACGILHVNNVVEIFNRYRRHLIDLRHNIMTDIASLAQPAFQLAENNESPEAERIIEGASAALCDGMRAVSEELSCENGELPVAFRGSLIKNHPAFGKMVFRKAKSNTPGLAPEPIRPMWHRRLGTCMLAISDPEENVAFKANSACKHLWSALEDPVIRKDFYFPGPVIEV